MALMGQYEYAIDAMHPRANQDGQVYLHIIIAEEKLGRYLLPDETVHHKDLNKLNNNPDNLIVFATKSDHTRFHSFDCDENFLELTPNGSYICNAKIHICLDCGATITHKAKRCVECSLKHKRTNRPAKQQLEDFLIRNCGNFMAASREYGVTDNAVRKWCLFYGLPSHSRDYKN
jgi:ribosomal protein L40E